jgi:hypothetical protein
MSRDMEEFGGLVTGCNIRVEDKPYKQDKKESYPVKEVETNVGSVVEISEEE